MPEQKKEINIVRKQSDKDKVVITRAEKTEHTLDECATRILNWLRNQEPMWAERIEALQEERGFSDKRVIASCVAFVLETGQHMSISLNSLFDLAEDDENRKWDDPRECPVCGEEYKPEYKAQPACLKEECGVELQKRRRLEAMA